MVWWHWWTCCFGCWEVVARLWCPAWPWQAWPCPWDPAADRPLKSPLHPLESDLFNHDLVSPPLPHSLLWLPDPPIYTNLIFTFILMFLVLTWVGEAQCLAWGGGGTLSTSTPFIFISFLYFILRFWNQILICLSVKFSIAAISMRLEK